MAFLFRENRRHVTDRQTDGVQHSIDVKSSRKKIKNVKNVTGMKKRINVFYRAMHFSAKRGIAIACRLSVRL